MHLPKVFLSALLACSVAAHPGHSVRDEVQKRGEFLARHTNNLDHCASIQKAAGFDERAVKRREARLDQLLQRSGLPSMSSIHLGMLNKS